MLWCGYICYGVAIYAMVWLYILWYGYMYCLLSTCSYILNLCYLCYIVTMKYPISHISIQINFLSFSLKCLCVWLSNTKSTCLQVYMMYISDIDIENFDHIIPEMWCLYLYNSLSYSLNPCIS